MPHKIFASLRMGHPSVPIQPNPGPAFSRALVRLRFGVQRTGLATRILLIDQVSSAM
jgi:hypothetical protein